MPPSLLLLKAYDKKYREYILGFPNKEVQRGFSNLIANGYFRTEKDYADSWASSLTKMFDRGDLEGIKDAYTSFLASIPYEADKDVRALNYETHFQYTFFIINRILNSFTTLIEKENSQGRADIVVESDDDIYIFEFKIDKPASEALQQIEDKGYALPYQGDRRRLHKIGVCISSQTRTVAQWEVR